MPHPTNVATSTSAGMRTATPVDDISALATQAISPAVAAVFNRYGFELRTLIARDSSASCIEEHAAEPLIELLSIARPSAIPAELSEQMPSLRGAQGEFRISLSVSRTARKGEDARPEATWSVPEATLSSSPYVRAYFTADRQWELQMSRAAQPALRREIDSTPHEVWRALFQALDEVRVAYERDWTSPRQGTPGYYEMLAASNPGVMPPWGIPY